MLHIPAVKSETKFKYTYESWSKMIDSAVRLPDPTDPIDPWQSSSPDDSESVGAAGPEARGNNNGRPSPPKPLRLWGGRPSAPTLEAQSSASFGEFCRRVRRFFLAESERRHHRQYR